MSELSELLTRANTEELSVQRLTDQMRARGHTIGRDTVWRYLTGRHAGVSDDYLKAFVDVLPGLDLDELRRAAALPPDLGTWEPPAEARSLDQRERDALDVLIKSIARGKTADAKVVPLGLPEASMEKGDQQPDAGVAEGPWTER